MRTARVLTSIPSPCRCVLWRFPAKWTSGSPKKTRQLNKLPRRHPQRPIEPDHLAVEVAVLDDVAHESGELLGPAEQLGEGDRGGEALLHLLGQRHQHRRVE